MFSWSLGPYFDVGSLIHAAVKCGVIGLLDSSIDMGSPTDLQFMLSEGVLARFSPNTKRFFVEQAEMVFGNFNKFRDEVSDVLIKLKTKSQESCCQQQHATHSTEN